MISENEAINIARILGVKFDKFPLEDFITGINV